jgi:hypothetical protein
MRKEDLIAVILIYRCAIFLKQLFIKIKNTFKYPVKQLWAPVSLWYRFFVLGNDSKKDYFFFFA